MGCGAAAEGQCGLRMGLSSQGHTMSQNREACETYLRDGNWNWLKKACGLVPQSECYRCSKSLCGSRQQLQLHSRHAIGEA